MSAIGLDFGTTYSCIATVQGGRVKILENYDGNRLIPSCVAFTDGERLFGETAKQQTTMNLENTIYNTKRMLGRRYDDKEFQKDSKLWGFEIIEERNKPKIKVKIKGENKNYFVEEINAMIMRNMRQMTEQQLGTAIEQAVIPVPAHFNNAQRMATFNAAMIAGFERAVLINEPTAAAIAYAYKQQSLSRILIYDLGGGTFDVTILQIENDSFHTLATDGDAHLGGEDFDVRIMEHFIKEFPTKNRADLRKNKRSIKRLLSACEKAKRDLSGSTVTSLHVDALFQNIDFSGKLTREQFDKLNKDYFEKTIQIVKRTLEAARLNSKEIDEIVLVGGSTRIPKIRNLLENLFINRKLNRTVNADEAVATGAAIVAAGLMVPDDEEIRYTEVSPFSLRVEGQSECFLFQNTEIPVMKTCGIKMIQNKEKGVTFSIEEGTMDKNECSRCGTYKIPIQFDHNHRKDAASESMIEVKFCIEASGIRKIIAIHPFNNKALEVEEIGRFSDAQILDMKTRENEFFHQDDIWKSRVQARNSLEEYAYQIKQHISEQPDNAASLEVIEKCDEVLQWAKTNQMARKRDSIQKRQELEKVWQKSQQKHPPTMQAQDISPYNTTPGVYPPSHFEIQQNPMVNYVSSSHHQQVFSAAVPGQEKMTTQSLMQPTHPPNIPAHSGMNQPKSFQKNPRGPYPY